MSYKSISVSMGTDKKAVYADKSNPPTMLPVKPDGIPAELKAERRWVMWKLLWKENKAGVGKWDKPPLTTAGRSAKSNDPATWTSFDEVLTAYRTGRFTGIGFMLGDGWVGADLDSVRNRDTGELVIWANKAVSLGGYAEVSPSGTGLKMLGRGDWPQEWNRKPHPHGGEVEVYASGRYFTITGHALGGGTSLDLQPTLNAAATLFAPPPPPAPPPETTGGASPESDDELLDRIRRSKQGAKFAALFDRRDMGEYDGDESRADMALCGILAWWCRGDADRIDRLFRRSALMRDKWDSPRKGSTWGRDTIDKVLRGQTEFYRPEGRKPKGKPRRGTDGDEGSGGGDEREGKPPVAELLANIAVAETELWHDPSGVPFASIGRRTMAVRSSQFRLWLTARYRAVTDGKVPAKEALSSAGHAVEARAVLDGPEHEAHVRVACHDGRVYLHLADAADRVIEVDAGGWRECEAPPVRFRRSSGARALPFPQRGGTLEPLRELLGIEDPDQFCLLVAFMCGALWPVGPVPLLVVNGEQGSGKTTLTRVVKRLIDPTAAEVRCEPKDARDLMLATRNNHVLCLENLSALKVWLSDALCRMATGGGLATRTLYTDDEETIFEAKRPVILNGIDEFVTRSDLLERSIPLALRAIAEERRVEEAVFWTTYDAQHPYLLGVLLDRVSGGMRELAGVEVRLPRMADFARRAVACERGAGETPRFLATYTASLRGSHEQVLECSSLGAAVVAMMAEKEGWSGTFTEMLEALTEYAPDPLPLDWPKAANALSGRLRRLAPDLRRARGIHIENDRSTDSFRKRIVRLRRVNEVAGEGPSAPSTSSGSPDSTAAGPDDPPDDPHYTCSGPSAVATNNERGSDGVDGADGLTPSVRPVTAADYEAFLRLH